jgi:hypothetical protein
MPKIKSNVDKILPYFKIINGKIVYNGRTRIISKGYNYMAFSVNGKILGCNINTVLIKYYKLKPPNTYNFYDLVRKDDTDLNVENLTWKIRLLCDYKYIPEVFYNNRNKIISKICGDCGENLPISKFTIMINKNTKNSTLKNICQSCRYYKQYERLKQDDVRYKKFKVQCLNFAKSKAGREYLRKYQKVWMKFQHDNLTDYYIKHLITNKNELSSKDIPQELIELKCKQLLLKRKIKNNG